MIVVIDYGMGNIGSIVNMLKKLGLTCTITCNPHEIQHAKAIILPGVGAFDNGMSQLSKSKLLPIMEEKVVKEKTPFLGICLGMHLLLEKSEEGQLPGLAWIPGFVSRFCFAQVEINNHLKIPHMGWNTTHTTKLSKIVPIRLNEDNRYYFVHSYHVNCDAKFVAATTHYGYEFPSLIKKDNIWGAQFHPEKSHKFGFGFFCDFLREAKCLEPE